MPLTLSFKMCLQFHSRVTSAFDYKSNFVLFVFEPFFLYLKQGNILYRFPSLQRTASPQRSGRKEYVGRKWADWVGGVEKFFKEKEWQFRFCIFTFSCPTDKVRFHIRQFAKMNTWLQCSKASTSEKAMVFGLGGLNLFGVIILGTMLKYVCIRQYTLISIMSSIPI